jgi:hypothetical protein
VKRRLLACILLVLLAGAGCSEETQTTPEIPKPFPAPSATIEAEKEVRPGIYISNDLNDFPFPTSGYEVYIVGEMHGNQETKQLFLDYLKSLHEYAGVRDVILEEHQAYEPDANEYVLGKTDALPEELCRRTDILGFIREFNTTLPDDQKVSVHLVDIDSPLSVVYKHLAELHTQLGSKSETIVLPTFSEFENWSPKQFVDLLTALENAAAGQPDILNGLETVHQSFRWYSMGNDLDTMNPATYQWKKYNSPREDIIAQNVQYVVTQLNGKPVLAFFGSAHAMKANPFLESPYKDLSVWAQRLYDANVSVYSLDVEPMAGSGYWRGESFQYADGAMQYRFEDGPLLSSLFETYPHAGIVYADLREEGNRKVKLPSNLSSGLQLQDMPASQVFDGLVLFKEVTPMKNECPGLD